MFRVWSAVIVQFFVLDYGLQFDYFYIEENNNGVKIATVFTWALFLFNRKGFRKKQ